MSTRKGRIRRTADQHGIDPDCTLPHQKKTKQTNLGINYETRAYLSNTSDDASKVNEVYKKLGVDLSDSGLKTQAITHKSFAHGSLPTNEKLGYLGKQGRKKARTIIFLLRRNLRQRPYRRSWLITSLQFFL